VILVIVLLGSLSRNAHAQDPAKPSPDERAERLKRSAELKARAEKHASEKKLEEAVAAAGQAMDLDMELFGAASPQAADALALLAGLHERREDWPAAAGARERVLAIRLKAGGADHWQTADARRAVEHTEFLGRLEPARRKALRAADDAAAEVARLDKLEQPKDTFDLARKVVKERQAVLGEGHWLVADAIHQLGRLHMGAKEWATARKVNENALAIRRKSLGELHPNTGRSWYNLGQALNELNDPQRAAQALRQAVWVWHATLGDEDKLTGMCLNRLGEVLSAHGDYAGAKQRFTKLLDIRRKTLGAAHSATADALARVGAVEVSLENFPAARKHFEEALAIYRKSQPISSSVLGDTLTRLAYVLGALKDLPGARTLYEEALPLLRKDPADRAILDWCLNNLASIDLRMGNPDRERKSREELLALRRTAQGNEHLLTADALTNLANVLHKQGEHAAARKLYEEGLAVYRKKDDPRRLKVARELNGLGLTLREQKAYPEARACHEEALAIHRKSLGKRHAATATSLSYLGETLLLLREDAAAKACQEEALAIRKALEGDVTLKQAEALKGEAAKLRAEGYLTTAVSSLEKALAIEREALGEHWTVAETLSLLASLREEKGDPDDLILARKLRQECVTLTRKLHGEADWRATDSRLALELSETNGKLKPEQQARLRVSGRTLDKAMRMARNELTEINAAQAIADKLNAKSSTIGPAVDLAREVLKVREELLGEGHPQTAEALDALGRLLLMQDKLDEAKRVLEKAVAVRRSALGATHPATARSLINLGVAVSHRNEHAAAVAHLREALEMLGRTAGAPLASTKLALQALSKAYRQLNDGPGEREVADREVELAVKMYGPDHPMTVATQLARVDAFQRSGESAAVRKDADTLTAAVRASSDPAMQGVLYFATLLQARILHAVGEHGSAAGLVEEGLTDFIQSQKSMGVFGAMLRNENPARIRDRHLRVRSVYRKLFDRDGRPLVSSATYVGFVFCAHGSFGDAQTVFKKVKDDPKAAGREAAFASWGLGIAALAEDRPAAGVAPLEEAATWFRRQPEADGADLAECLYDLGTAYLRVKKLVAAKGCLAEAAALLRLAQQAESDLRATALLSLADVQYSLHEYPAARASMEQGLAIRRKLFAGHCQRLRESEGYRFAHAVELWYDFYTNLGASGILLPAHYEQIFETVRQSVPKEHPAAASLLSELVMVIRGVVSDEVEQRCEQEAAEAARFRPAPPARPRRAPAAPATDLRADPVYLLRLEEQKLSRQAYDLELEGKLEKAVETLELLLRNVEKRSGEASDAMIASLERVARVEERMGRWDAAVARYRKVLDLLQLPDTDPRKPPESRPTTPEVLAARLGAARGSLANAEFMTKLTPEQHARVRNADEQYKKAKAGLKTDPVAARDGFRQALTIRKEIFGPSHRETLDCRRELIAAYRRASDLPAAANEADEYIAVLRTQDPSQSLPKALLLAGTIARAAGKTAEETKYLEEAVRTARRATPPAKVEASSALTILGSNALTRGDAVGASRYLEDALSAPEFVWEVRWIAEITLGWAATLLSDITRAEKLFLTALDRRKLTSGDEVMRALALQGLGQVAYLRGDLDAARLHYDDAEVLIRKAEAAGRLSRSSEEQLVVAQGLQLKGLLTSELGDQKAAFRQLLKAVDLYRKLLPEGHPELALLRGHLASVLMRDQEYRLAEGILDKSVAILRKSPVKDDPRLAALLVIRGTVRNMSDNFKAAREDLEVALATFRKVNPRPNLVTARVLLQLGFALTQLGELSPARERLAEAKAMIQTAGGEQSPLMAAHGLWAGLLALREKDPKRAAGELRAMVESTRRQLTRIAGGQSEREQLTLLRDFRKRFDLYLSVATKGEADPADLYRELLTWKGCVTHRQSQERTDRDGTDADVRALLADLQEVDQALAALSQPDAGPMGKAPSPVKLRDLEQQREKLERDLLERSAAARRGKERAARTPPDIRAALPEDAVLVDFLQYGHVTAGEGEGKVWSKRAEIVAFVIRKDSDRVAQIDLGSAQAVARLVEKWRASYGSGRPPSQDESDPAQALRELVWKPLEPHLGSAKLVFLSPDGPLSGLPFPALPGTRPGTYLLEERSFVIMPVPQRLPDLTQAQAVAKDGPWSLLLVGDVNFDARLGGSETRSGSALPSRPLYRALPGTQAELEAVKQSFATRFPRGSVTILQKDAATKDRFVGEGGRNRYLHLATHGFFAGESVRSAVAESDEAPSVLLSELEPKSIGKPPGMLSGVAFAGVNRPGVLGGDNGILTAQEAAELNLQQAELVVLSACDTGRGRVAGLEGVLGLQRAFQVAGARTVVASLWSVEDSATRALMTLFYRNLWEKKLPKAEALRQAQMEMIRNFRYDAGSRQVVDLRGGGKRIDDPEAVRKLEERLARLKKSGEPLPPFFWAAFVLSGDWR